jgi:hypothetical protein
MLGRGPDPLGTFTGSAPPPHYRQPGGGTKSGHLACKLRQGSESRAAVQSSLGDRPLSAPPSETESRLCSFSGGRCRRDAHRSRVGCSVRRAYQYDREIARSAGQFSSFRGEVQPKTEIKSLLNFRSGVFSSSTIMAVSNIPDRPRSSKTRQSTALRFPSRQSH